MANIPVDDTPIMDLEMERFETKTPVHADEMNKRHKQHLDNEKALVYPEFDDGGTVSGISSFPEFLDTVKSKIRIFDFFKNFKAGMQFVLHTGMIVNNAATDNSNLPVSAAVAKDLQDQVTQLYSDLSMRVVTSLSPASSDLKIFHCYLGRNAFGVTGTFRFNYATAPATDAYKLITTLPDGYRPAGQLWLAMVGNDGTSESCYVDTAGQVYAYARTSFTTTAHYTVVCNFPIV